MHRDRALRYMGCSDALYALQCVSSFPHIPCRCDPSSLALSVCIATLYASPVVFLFCCVNVFRKGMPFLYGIYASHGHPVPKCNRRFLLIVGLNNFMNVGLQNILCLRYKLNLKSMKNLIKSFSVFAMAAMLLTSCATDPCGNDKDDFLKKFNTLVDKIEAIDYDTENSKWEDYNDEFKNLVEECYKIHEDDLSRREERKFGKQVAVYYVKTFTGNVDIEKHAAEFGKMLDENMGDISNQISKAVEGIDIDINLDDQEIEALFEELGSDIDKMGKKWGKKLEKILEKQ